MQNRLPKPEHYNSITLVRRFDHSSLCAFGIPTYALTGDGKTPLGMLFQVTLRRFNAKNNRFSLIIRFALSFVNYKTVCLDSTNYDEKTHTPHNSDRPWLVYSQFKRWCARLQRLCLCSCVIISSYSFFTHFWPALC